MGVLFGLAAFTLYHFGMAVYEKGYLAVSVKWQGVVGWGGVVVLGFWGLFISAWRGGGERWQRVAQAGFDGLRRLRILNLALFLVMGGGFFYVVFGGYGRFFDTAAARLILLLWATAGGGILLSAWGLRERWEHNLAISLLILSIGYVAVGFSYWVSAHPFTLFWSEGSRYYYASLFFSGRIYGVEAAWPITNPSRYLMQAVPFLIPGAPLWLHRLWQVGIWVALLYYAAVLVARRLEIADRDRRLLFIAWAFLFIYQGPVYYQLLLCVVIVLRWFDSRKFWRSLGVVLIASVWAGISRLNWIPVPGLMGAALYFLAHPVPNKGPKAWLNYLVKPLVWFGLGSAAALGSQLGYAALSGNTLESFGSSLTSDLLWYRLLPNPSYSLGVLTGTLLASVPVLAVMLRYWPDRRRWHPLRLLGLGSILLVLLGGGLVASVKIGGGTNLHNLDAYLIILLLVGGYLYAGKFVPDAEQPIRRRKLSMPAMALVLLIPAFIAITLGGSLTHPGEGRTAEALAQLEALVAAAGLDGGRILFITERQLVTFNYLEGVSLVEDYEKMIFMEMVMAGNEDYIDTYLEAIRSQQFALIVTDPLKTNIKDPTIQALAEENNVWVETVSIPTRCYYEQVGDWEGFGFEVYVPREEPVCP